MGSFWRHCASVPWCSDLSVTRTGTLRFEPTPTASATKITGTRLDSQSRVPFIKESNAPCQWLPRAQAKTAIKLLTAWHIGTEDDRPKRRLWDAPGDESDFHNKQKAKNATNLSREHSAQRDGNGLCLMAQNAKQTEGVNSFSHAFHVFHGFPVIIFRLFKVLIFSICSSVAQQVQSSFPPGAPAQESSAIVKMHG